MHGCVFEICTTDICLQLIALLCCDKAGATTKTTNMTRWPVSQTHNLGMFDLSPHSVPCRNSTTAGTCMCGPVCSATTGCIDAQCGFSNMVTSTTRNTFNYTAPSTPSSPAPYVPPTSGVYQVLSGYQCTSYDLSSFAANGSASGCVSSCTSLYSLLGTPLGPDTSFLFWYK